MGQVHFLSAIKNYNKNLKKKKNHYLKHIYTHPRINAIKVKLTAHGVLTLWNELLQVKGTGQDRTVQVPSCFFTVVTPT